MKPTYLILCVGLLCPPARAISGSGFTPADDSPVISDPNRMPVPQTASAVGAISAKDSVKQMIQMQNEVGQVLSFYVETNTPIQDGGGRQLTFEQLKPGDTVNVNFLADSLRVNQISRIRS